MPFWNNARTILPRYTVLSNSESLMNMREHFKGSFLNKNLASIELITLFCAMTTYTFFLHRCHENDMAWVSFYIQIQQIRDDQPLCPCFWGGGMWRSLLVEWDASATCVSRQVILTQALPFSILGFLIDLYRKKEKVFCLFGNMRHIHPSLPALT